jgi:hypothetical protein
MNSRRSLLTAALGFALLRTRAGSALPETEMLCRWLDTWRGVGDVIPRGAGGPARPRGACSERRGDTRHTF